MPKIAPKLASKPSSMTAPINPTPVCTSSPSLPPPPAMSEPNWLTGPALKAAHEHTYATQRVKKAADRAKSKMPPRKVPSSGGRSSSSSPSSFSSASGGAGFTLSSSPTRAAAMAGLWAEVWEARKTSTDDPDWPELSNWSPPPAECSPLRPTQDREVPLSALVRPVKPRGAKAKAKEGEFEFLPPVKNVIVLDDAESNAPDEPWEYISSVGGDDEARKIFSYAEIVSKTT
ncbi:hypothetical protein BGY98DRAFT_932173 [Russula aff. rugulosa BPL654]|nr:hypothetical protein BGY98DRAFT_932173 [Russula aff. rugulosa BPL654]